MKFCYVDETGDQGQSDVFVMVGLLIDAYRLRKYTASFDRIIVDFLAEHPGAPTELKTKALINGTGGWSQVSADDRKNFLTVVCDLAAECTTVFAIALSFEKFSQAAASGKGQPFGTSYWLSAALFVASLIQARMQQERGNKGLTVLICDDNKMEMANLSDALYKCHAWFDPIYQQRKKNDWKVVLEEERFDQIINSAFAIKSQHSSLVQAADAAAYIFRRHLELKAQNAAWEGEKEYFTRLVDKLAAKRARLGRTPGGPCIEFYQDARHPEWRL